MDRPFREVHELYKILYERAQQQQEEAEKHEKEEKEKAQKEKKANPNIHRQPSDVKDTIPTPSPLELEALEDAIEEIM